MGHPDTPSQANPYLAPNAELVSKAAEPFVYNSVGWKILFFLLLPLHLWTIYEDFAFNSDGYGFGLNLLSALVYSLFLLGLLGLSFKYVFLRSIFWQILLAVLVLLDCFYLYDAIVGEPELMEHTTILFVALGMIAPLFVIGWFAIYKYSTELKLWEYKQHHINSSNSD